MKNVVASQTIQRIGTRSSIQDIQTFRGGVGVVEQQTVRRDESDRAVAELGFLDNIIAAVERPVEGNGIRSTRICEHQIITGGADHDIAWQYAGAEENGVVTAVIINVILAVTDPENVGVVAAGIVA